MEALEIDEDVFTIVILSLPLVFIQPSLKELRNLAFDFVLTGLTVNIFAQLLFGLLGLLVVHLHVCLGVRCVLPEAANQLDPADHIQITNRVVGAMARLKSFDPLSERDSIEFSCLAPEAKLVMDLSHKFGNRHTHDLVLV